MLNSMINSPIIFSLKSMIPYDVKLAVKKLYFSFVEQDICLKNDEEGSFNSAQINRVPTITNLVMALMENGISVKKVSIKADGVYVTYSGYMDYNCQGELMFRNWIW